MMQVFAEDHVTLRIGKQHELPKRPGDYRPAKGDLNQVPPKAFDEAAAMKDKREPPVPAAEPADAKCPPQNK